MIMELFDVYKKIDMEPITAKGCYLYDSEGTRFLDLYGGHAVISIGHSHADYLQAISLQLKKIGFYSNTIANGLQKELAMLLGKMCGYPDYRLFLCNSGAEANENALKIASFHTGRRKVLAFKNAFHGRTAATLAISDNPQIRPPLIDNHSTCFLPLNQSEALPDILNKEEYCAVIIEGIQGIGGVVVPESDFLKYLEKYCRQTGTVLILDEIQAGYGRTGKFFAHQHDGIRADLITVAKGMGNGFPIAGVLIHSRFKAKPEMLGTTFGGNHLACRAGIAVLNVMQQENLLEHAALLGQYMSQNIRRIQKNIEEVRGRGLMIGIQFSLPAKPLQKKLLSDYHILTGSSWQQNTLRLLPPLTLKKSEADYFLESLNQILKE
jgi:acetylornithine aminotransferase